MFNMHFKKRHKLSKKKRISNTQKHKSNQEVTRKLVLNLQKALMPLLEQITIAQNI